MAVKRFSPPHVQAIAVLEEPEKNLQKTIVIQQQNKKNLK
jgi:hypothetical protein